MNNKKSTVGYISAISTMILWGSLYVFNGVALQTLNPFEVAFFRFLLSAIALFIIMKIKGIPTALRPEDRKAVWIIGFLGYFICIDFTLLGIYFTGSVMSSILAATNPIVIPIAAYIILKEKMSRIKKITIGAAMIGVLVISSGKTAKADLLGMMFVILGVFAWAVASTYMRKIGSHYPPFVVTFRSILASLASTSRWKSSASSSADCPPSTPPHWLPPCT